MNERHKWKEEEERDSSGTIVKFVPIKFNLNFLQHTICSRNYGPLMIVFCGYMQFLDINVIYQQVLQLNLCSRKSILTALW